jgi:hypothetical protein
MNAALILNLIHPKNKKYFTDSRENDFKLLSQLAYEGLSKIS